MPVTLPELALTLFLALVATLLVVAVTHLVVILTSRRWPVVGNLSRHAAVPFRLVALVLVVAAVRRETRPEQVSPGLWVGVELALRLASIATVAWLVGALLLFLEDLGLQRYRTDVSDNQDARRLRTKVIAIRRLTVALVVLVAAGAALLTFPGVRAVGASLLASAGRVSVVVGVAAQSALATVFAGIQLAFSDAIRIDDAVVVDGQWGRIDEITLSHVVVQLWDDRRLVRVRVLVSAVDASALWDLRCHVRERLVTWARQHAGAVALPRQRVELVQAPATDAVAPAALGAAS